MGWYKKLRPKTKNPYKAQVKVGKLRKSTWHPTVKSATDWIRDKETEYRRLLEGQEPTTDNLKKKTVGDLCAEYLQRVTPRKASKASEEDIINIFLSHKDFRKRPLIAFRKTDANEYRDYLETSYVFHPKTYVRNGKEVYTNRSPKSLKPGTIKRHIAILRNIWAIAADEEWRGFENLLVVLRGNPWSKVNPHDIEKERTRRLRGDELERLLEACNSRYSLYKDYGPLAIFMATSIGLRRQEVFGLKWEDINYQDRTIRIAKSKTDKKKKTDGRTICMPFCVELILYGLNMHKECKPTDYLFPINKNNWSRVWTDLNKRAGIPLECRDYKHPITGQIIKSDKEGLKFHDLRREATLMFDAAGLTEPEKQLILGQEPDTIIGKHYNQPLNVNLKTVVDKIDQHMYGMTREQFAEMTPEEYITRWADHHYADQGGSRGMLQRRLWEFMEKKGPTKLNQFREFMEERGYTRPGETSKEPDTNVVQFKTQRSK